MIKSTWKSVYSEELNLLYEIMNDKIIVIKDDEIQHVFSTNDIIGSLTLDTRDGMYVYCKIGTVAHRKLFGFEVDFNESKMYTELCQEHINNLNEKIEELSLNYLKINYSSQNY